MRRSISLLLQRSKCVVPSAAVNAAMLTVNPNPCLGVVPPQPQAPSTTTSTSSDENRIARCCCVPNDTASLTTISLSAMTKLSSSNLTITGCQMTKTAAAGGTGAPPAAAKVFKCSECSKTFRLFNALQHHIKTKHAGMAKAIAIGADGKEITDDKPAAAAAPAPAAAAASATPAAAAGSDATSGAAATSWASSAASTPAGTTVTDATSRPGSAPATEEVKKVFTCTICQKSFRLEAALIHHYQAKHGTTMASASGETTTPASSGATSTDATAAGGDAAGAAGIAGTTTITDSMPNVNVASGFQYIASPEVVEPQPPQYHIEVAPNAPEESEIAAHAVCVNQMTVVGEVSEVSTGYVFETPSIQFTVATEFENPPAGDPDKDFHTVRCLGMECCERLRDVCVEGNRVLVSGRLRLVPQYESVTNKYYHFPVLHVNDGSCDVVLLEKAMAAAAEATSSSSAGESSSSSTTEGSTAADENAAASASA